MANKFTDFTQLGGFPLTEDDLKYDRDGVYGTMAAIFGDAGATPIILAGDMATSAWVLVNGEILPFAVFGTLPPLPAGYDYYVLPSETKDPVTFEDLSSKNAINCVRTLGLVSGDTAAPPVGGKLRSEFVPWQQIFGNKARGAWATITGTASTHDWTVDYRKNVLTNTVRLKGTITIKNTVATGNYFYGIGTLPNGFRPSFLIPFSAQYRFHNSALKESTSSDFIDVMNATVYVDGTITMGMRRPDTSVTGYQVSFDVTIPLD